MRGGTFEGRRWIRARASLAIVVVVCASACSGGDDAPPSVDVDAGSSEGGGGSGGGKVRCPDAEPTAGDACASALKSCMYGDSVRPDCRRVWSCDGGAWKAPAPMSCTQPVACPSAEPVEGPPCAHANDICTYGDSMCICEDCSEPGCSGPSPVWVCAGPPGGGCPDRVPNLGSACSDEGRSCSYWGGSCRTIDGAEAICTHGEWEWGGTCF
jgi:hypothetical protein